MPFSVSRDEHLTAYNYAAQFGRTVRIFMDLSELMTLIKAQGESIDNFKSHYIERLDEIDKRLNRPTLVADVSARETPEQRKSIELGIRALLAGNQAQADRHFAEAKGMSVGVDPDGGYLVTPTFSSDMTRVMLETAPFIGLARTIELTQGDSFEEIVDRAEADAQWVGEVQSRGDTTTPKVELFNCPVHELHAQPKASQKVIDVARIDILAWLQGKVGEKFANAEVVGFFTGNGVAKPRGFLSYPTVATSDATRAWGTLEHVVTGVNGAFSASNPADILIDLVATLKPQYRSGANWLMNRRTAAAVRKFKDSNGQYIWTNAITAGQPPTLLGHPVVEAEQMPDMATGSLSISFGNFKVGYTIVRRLGVRFLTDPYTDKPNVRLYSIERVGGGVNNSEAIKLLKFSV